MTEAFTLAPTVARQPGRVRRGGWSWGPVEDAKLRVLSMGAGVQSTTLALMALKGEVGPRPDAMIFANTGDDSGATMRHLAWLEAEVTRQTNGQMRTIRVAQNRKLSDDIRARTAADGSRFTVAPFFTGNGGQGKRQCTREFKVEPLTKMQRGMLGFRPRQRIPARSCEVWVGISTDEVVRAGASFDRWAVNRYPLLEQRMSRHDCELWLTRNGYPVPPKSACVFCPYRTNREWRWMRDNDPESWAIALKIDGLIRNTPGMRNAEFVHRDRVPLGEVDLSTDEDRGQGMLEVCEAGCGL